MKPGIIYRIHCRETRFSYIGQTRQTIKSRWGQHCRSLNKGTHTADLLQRDWSIYGADAFKFTVIETIPLCPQWLLNARERYWIKRLGYYNERHRKLYRGRSRAWAEQWAWNLVWILVGAGIGTIFVMIFN